MNNAQFPNRFRAEDGGDVLRFQRGSFYGQYAIPAERRDKRRTMRRLLECVRCIAQADDPEFHDPCDDDEFAVIDLITREKAWLERPAGTTPDELRALIESHFAAPALRAAADLWLV